MKGSSVARGPARILVVGYPGSAKTGSLAALANAGLKLRILAYDKLANVASMLQYVEPSKLDNVDILAFEDELSTGPTGGKTLEPQKTPHAFADGLRAMDRWAYKDPNTGEDVDLGSSKDWGLDTVVVLDSLTAMGEAAMRRARAMTNKTLRDTTDGTWGLAMNEQDAFIERLVSNENRHHVIVLSHLKIVAPRENRKGDDQLSQTIKQAVADLIPARLYPSALGKDLPQKIARHFPVTVLAEASELAGSRVVRQFRVLPRPELDLKLPALDAGKLDKLPVETGLLNIFNAVTPGVEACLREAARVATKKET